MKTANLLLFANLFPLFALPNVYAEPDINVVPMSYDFGEVEAGSSETVLILISNVEEETLVGSGPGKSAKNRLNALLDMLETAKSLIEEERCEEACEQLNSAYKTYRWTGSTA